MWEELGEYAARGQQAEAGETAENFDAPGGENVVPKDSDKKEAEEKVAAKQKPKKGMADRIQSAPLPHIQMPTGSIGLMLLAILLLVFAVVPVPTGSGSNETRLSLLWGAFTGRVKVGGIGNSPSQTGDQSPGNTSKSNSTQASPTTPSSGTGAPSHNPFYHGW